MESGRASMVSSAFKRVATAIVFIPVFVWIVTRAPGWAFAALLTATAAVALWELYRLFEHAGQPCQARLGLMLGIALVVSFEVVGGRVVMAPLFPALVLSIAVGVILSAPIVTGGRPATEGVAITLLGVVYVGWFLGHALLLHRRGDGDALILVLV